MTLDNYDITMMPATYVYDGPFSTDATSCSLIDMIGLLVFQYAKGSLVWLCLRELRTS